MTEHFRLEAVAKSNRNRIGLRKGMSVQRALTAPIWYQQRERKA